MRDHRVEDRVVGDVRRGQAELGGQRLLGAQALARADAGALVEPLQLVAAGRCFQIFDHRHVGADSCRISSVLREVPHIGLWWMVAFISGNLTIKRDQFHLWDHEPPPKDAEPATAGGHRESIIIAAKPVDDQAGDDRADDPRNIAERILDADPAPRGTGPGEHLGEAIEIGGVSAVPSPASMSQNASARVDWAMAIPTIATAMAR